MARRRLNPSKKLICLKIYCNDTRENIRYLILKQIFKIKINFKEYTIISGEELLPFTDVILKKFKEPFKVLRSYGKGTSYYPFNVENYKVSWKIIKFNF